MKTKTQAATLSLLLLTFSSSLQWAAEVTEKDTGGIKGVKKAPAKLDPEIVRLLPYAELKNNSLFKANADVIEKVVREKKAIVSRKQFEHYCGSPDGIAVDGNRTMTVYFYTEYFFEPIGDDGKRTWEEMWVMYVSFRNGKLESLGVNEASVNDHSKFRKLKPEKFPNINKG
ncbi:hypothetical protein [Persicirhabdus sediminis]|uniref:Uncharacterized protein n=1 Tax=Persicirhabdus sediminis TaxID=454144 RepID=A0A8J7MFT9_9BACT|nr:hypothetical protein [Persicirhabdus sediminis]MBK1791986.1 hypothetical protein [Persicirhabdus sediminis]